MIRVDIRDEFANAFIDDKEDIVGFGHFPFLEGMFDVQQ